MPKIQGTSQSLYIAPCGAGSIVFRILYLVHNGGARQTDRQPEHRHRHKAQCDSLWLFGGYEMCYSCIQHSACSAEGKQVICCSEEKFLSLQTLILLLGCFLNTVCVACFLYCPHFTHSSGTCCMWNQL